MENMPFGIEKDNDLVGKIRAIAHARTPDMGEMQRTFSLAYYC